MDIIGYKQPTARSLSVHPLLWRLGLLVSALIVTTGFGAKDSAPFVKLTVDASEAPRRIIRARLDIPAQPGPLTLFYPKWIPGDHSPSGPIVDLIDVTLSASGNRVAWNRDLVDMYAFHCSVPKGADSLHVELTFLSSTKDKTSFLGVVASTAQLAVINWNLVVLYPNGWRTDELLYQANLRLPDGWKYGTALPVMREVGDTVEFEPVSLSSLVDSPVIAGAHFRAIPLKSTGTQAHEIDVAADDEAAINYEPMWRAGLNRLVDETGTLFGARHYRRYCFLLALTDFFNVPDGTEHHESSDNRGPEQMLVDSKLRATTAFLLPHEFIHSWNGKYRRPVGLNTPDFQQPMKGDLLWVYEGLTRYLDRILTVRSGLWTSELYREYVAMIAADLELRSGRSWRSLEDTAVSAPILLATPGDWTALQRPAQDFYDESLLIWLEADAVIRRQNPDHSLDDFCRLFYGGPTGFPTVAPYGFDDLISSLRQVADYNWRSFFKDRIYSINLRAPVAGIEKSGWHVVYSAVPNEYITALDYQEKQVNDSYSSGLRLKEDGTIADVIPNLTAGHVGLAPNMKVIAVNGRSWSPRVFREALIATKTDSRPLELLIENAGFLKGYRLDYRGGEKYPHLERDPTQSDLLEQILKARTNEN
jgi:predicted metalloprotease with PDZ domain